MYSCWNSWNEIGSQLAATPKAKEIPMQGSVRQRLARGFCLLALSSLACQHDPAVLIHLRNGDLVRVPVELAMTPEARARGLMYRHDLPPDAGMLFAESNAQAVRLAAGIASTLAPSQFRVFLDQPNPSQIHSKSISRL